MELTDLFAAIHYAPHFGQVRFHASDARFKVLIAGARFGKSLAAGKDVLRELLAADSRGWMVGPTFSLARPEFDYLIHDAEARLALALTAMRSGGRGHVEARFANGASVSCLSAKHPASLLGREVDWMILCEAAHIGRDAWERFLRGRLVSRRGRLVVPTTPRGHNWLKDLYERGLGGDPAWESFRFATWDNPLVSAQEIESARQELAPEVFDEQFGGAFTARAGRVYPEFERARHVAAIELFSGMRFWRGVDFGFTNPFSCLWVALDSDDRLLVFDEFRAAGATLAELAAEISRRDEAIRARGLLCAGGVADPSGRAQREELARLGIMLAPADNSLGAGIDAVRRRLRERKDGRPGLLIDPRCAGLIGEFEGYCYEEASGGEEALPRKLHDHSLDALRYVCMTLTQRVGWRGVVRS